MKPRNLFLAILLLLGAENMAAQTHQAYNPSFRYDGAHRKVNNVIFLIGDGMGLAQITAGAYANRGELTLLNLKNIGFVRTQSTTGLTTDSAAAATAYATGQKTYNGAVGLDIDTLPIQNITETLAALGWQTGVLTTDHIDGATPAGFYAHQKSRNMAREILGDLALSRLTFFGGGSIQRIEKKRPELMSELSRAGFMLFEDTPFELPNVEHVAIIPDQSRVEPISKGRGDFLPKTTAFALDWLKSRRGKGFFIMVEGAQIDWGGHNNDFQYIVSEMLDFDLAVEAAIRFAEKDGHTLVIITADHETSGLSIDYTGDIATGTVSGNFASNNHTPILVPIFAYGPYSDLFRGVQDNTDIPKKILHILTGK